MSKSLRVLATVFFLSGIWDLIAALVYSLMIGTVFREPPVHRFYAIFIASFLYCFAYLQILSAFNIERYLLNIGAVMIGRLFYVILLFSYMFGFKDFPNTFWWTGVVDLCWSIAYAVIVSTSNEIRLKELFLPRRRDD